MLLVVIMANTIMVNIISKLALLNTRHRFGGAFLMPENTFGLDKKSYYILRCIQSGG